MATLEKIRSKSVLLIIVIGVALLAFIIGDFLTNSRNIFGNTTTVAQIGDQKIDVAEYQNKLNEINDQFEQLRQQNPQQAAQYDPQTFPQMAVQQLVNEKLFSKAVDQLGIQASDAELSDYMMKGNNPKVNELVGRMIQNQMLTPQPSATPEQIIAQAHEIIFNPKRNGKTEQEVAGYRAQWLAIEGQASRDVEFATYRRLLVGCLKPNDLDKRNLYNDYVSTSVVEYAFKPVGQVDEKKYPVSDKELQAEYDRVKDQRYKVDMPTKGVSFVAVPVEPSKADADAAKALSAKTLAEVKASKALSKDARKAGVSTSSRTLPLAQVPAASPTGAFLRSASADSCAVVAQGMEGFTIVRMGSRVLESDSISLRVVNVLGKNLPSQVLARVEAGLPLDSLASRFPADSVMVTPVQQLYMFDENLAAGEFTPEMLDSIKAAPRGRLVTLQSLPAGTAYAYVESRTEPKEVVSFDEYSFQLKPSTATVDEAREKFAKFLAANPTADKFGKNAAAAGYNVQKHDISANSPAIPWMPGFNQYMPETQQVVRWIVVEGKQGDVSPVYENKDAMSPTLYAVAVDSEFDDYKPFASVKEELTPAVRARKAAKEMAKQYQGKGSVQQTAAAMGVEPQTAESFRFGSLDVIPDMEVMGKVAGAKPGVVVVVPGENGVFVYKVSGKTTEKFPYDDESYKQQYMRALSSLDMDKMLRGSKKLQNNLYNFIGGK